MCAHLASLVLLVLLSLSTSALAQELVSEEGALAPLPTPTGYSEQAPTALPMAEQAELRYADGPIWARVPVEALVGLIMGAGLNLTVIAIFGVFDPCDERGDILPDSFECGVTTGSVLAPFATALGVWSIGHAFGANGSYLWSLVGAAAGTALGIAVALIGSEGDIHRNTEYAVVGFGVGVVASVAGAILGFELSSDVLEPSERPEPITWLPTLAPLPDGGGAVAGVVGVF